MSCAGKRLSGIVAVFVLATPFTCAQNRGNSKAPVRVLLRPQFSPGLIMRYRLSLQSSSASNQSGLVKDPHGPAQVEILWEATVRLEILPLESESGSASDAARSMRLRIIYESSQASIRSDTPEPRSDEIQKQYAELAGKSLEFTINGAGHVSQIRGLESLVDDAPARDAAQKWIQQLSSAAGAPRGGIVPGQKWTSIEAADLPLAGRSWRTEFMYLRNAPCPLASEPQSDITSGANSRLCAVIQSNLSLVTTRALRDPTPDGYKRNGLRTSGRWNGAGQGEMYVSLDTGWVVSSAQESTENMDVSISAASSTPADSTSSVRQSGEAMTRLHVFLLPSVDVSSKALPPQ